MGCNTQLKGIPMYETLADAKFRGKVYCKQHYLILQEVVSVTQTHDLQIARQQYVVII